MISRITRDLVARPYTVEIWRADLDGEPGQTLRIRNRFTADLFHNAPTGAEIPLLDVLSGEWLTVTKRATSERPWKASPAVLLADLDDRPTFDIHDPIRLEESDLLGLFPTHHH